MVRALEEEQENYRSRLNHFKGIYENTGRQAHSTIESSGPQSQVDYRVTSRSQASQPLSNEPMEKRNIGYPLNRNDIVPRSPLPNDTGEKHPAVSLEKRELFEERAETILLIIKHRFPGIPQSSLEISKIQYNRDVGQAILESYSRILESLAFAVMSRIEDVLHADHIAQNPSLRDKKRHFLSDTSIAMRKEDFLLLSSKDGPVSMTLSDFMGWTLDQGDAETKKEITDSLLKEDDKSPKKPGNIVTNKKFSYIDKLGDLGGIRSPTARH